MIFLMLMVMAIPEEPISKASKEMKKEKELVEDDEKEDKDLSKVPPEIKKSIMSQRK